MDVLELDATYSDEATAAVAADAWTSSNTAIATVDEDGLVTGATVGKAIITGRLSGASSSAVVTVTASLSAGVVRGDCAPDAAGSRMTLGQRGDGGA